MDYNAKCIGVETDQNTILYKFIIINKRTSAFRDIRIKFRQLQELNASLMQDMQNHYYDFPYFPDKQNVELIEVILSEYFLTLTTRPPEFNQPLQDFLSCASDIFRQKELSQEISTKKELLKLIKPEKVLNQSFFGKTTLCQFQGKKVILHKFYVLKAQSEELFKKYFNLHVLFTDFTYICQVIHIFFLHARFNLIDSIFSNTKHPRTCKKQHFQQLFPQMNKQEVVKLFSIEVYEGQSLEEIIKERKMKQTPFKQFELLHLIQNLIEVLIYFHNNKCYPNWVTTTNIIINKGNIKLTGIHEPNEKYKEKLLIEGSDLKSDKEYDSIYIPPQEQIRKHQNLEQINVNLWQFGICLTKASLLYTNKELVRIYEYDFFKETIQKIKNKYGKGIGRLIRTSLKQKYSTDFNYLNELANYDSIIPFQSVFLNQTQESSLTVLRINCLDQSEQLKFKDQLKKSTTISIKINLFEQEVDTQQFDKLMTYLGDLEIVRDIQIILNKAKFVNISTIFCSLSSIKSVINLNLDLKGIIMDQNDIIYGLQTMKQMNFLKRLTVDCSNMDFISFLKAELEDEIKMICYYESQLI